jgi:restriction system protein
MALDTIEAYIIAHIIFLPDIRLNGLNDAMAVIRARYLEAVHPRETLITLSFRDFEYLVAALYSKMDYKVTVTQPSRDGGYDIRASRDDPGYRDLVLVECKRYKDNVGVIKARALMGVVEEQGANKGTIITTANFTKDARKFAESNHNRMELIDYSQLNNLLNTYLGQDWPVRLDSHITRMKAEEAKTIGSRLAR